MKRFMICWCAFFVAWSAFFMVVNVVERNVFAASAHSALFVAQLYYLDRFRQRL